MTPSLHPPPAGFHPAKPPETWPDRGGDKIKTENGTRRAPLPLLDRPFPADTDTLFCLGALAAWPQARERFKALGIPPLSFIDGDAVALAAMFLADREATAHDLGILERDDRDRTTWIFALEWHRPTDAAWAARAVDRFAVACARRWMPAWLRWAAERMEAGAWTLAHAAEEIDAILRLARPALLDGRAAA